MTTSSTCSELIPAPPVGTKRIQLVLVLGVLTALGPFTVDMYLPALPAIAVDFETSESTVQLTLTGTLIGLALGQLVIGPVSDRYGRRRPLLLGTAVHVVASVACYFAPTITVLGAFRTVQGVGAAATAVIATAVVRDLFSGRAAAVMFSHLMLVMGVAPILAPSIGGILMTTMSWHGVFLVLAVLAALLMLIGAVALPETLPPSHRSRRGLAPALRTYTRLVRDGRFMTLVLVCGLGRAVLWAYIAGSSFVMQREFELDPTVYGMAFAAGGVVLIGAAQLNVRLLDRWSPARICIVALAVSVAVGVAFVAVALHGTTGFMGFAVPVLALLCATGFVMPNAPALALTRHGDAAGTAAAIVGFAQFGTAAVVAPIVGVLGNTALAVAVTMTSCAVLAVLSLGFGVRPNARRHGGHD
ncbi:multidrug effflux MFS transporter [Rhodococcus sp. NM-2]|uniref:multidrug effflux MFS transporter n=1 Tax=Rhodococcus sp. NM-2 TaxID=3401174 RepID=UPI003AAD8ACA